MGFLDLPDRFLTKVKVDRFTGCWEWVAFSDKIGYGRYQLCGRQMLAHRVSYEAECGPIPDGLVIDHLCRNPSCVNPAHLEAVTQLENVRRGKSGLHNARKTHCPRGHEYTPENLLPRKNGKRDCRECSRIRDRARSDRQKSSRKV